MVAFFYLFKTQTVFTKGHAAAAASLDGARNWIVSGGAGPQISPLQSTWKFIEEFWAGGPNLPFGLMFHCQVLFETRVFILGGLGSGGLDSSATLELADYVWLTVSPMHTARSQHSCIDFERKIYSIGGVNSNGGVGSSGPLSSVEVYDPDRNVWEPGPYLPRGVYQAQVINYHNTVYLVGWQDNTQVFTLSADPGAEWQVLDGVLVSEETRNIFPAPLLTSEMLPCVLEEDQ